ncbi:MAG: ABC-type transport auxiliary lipoprotein family protein [Gammaproteobacteria bacterium]
MKRAGATFAALALLAACAPLPPPQADHTNIYVLEAMPAAGTPRPKHDLVLEVTVPRAWPGFDTPQMAYTQRADQLAYFAKNRWVDTPANMLAPLLVQVLEQSGAFRAVVQAPSLAAADLRLDTEIVRLQQDFSMRPSRVQFTLQAQLIDIRGRRVLASTEFDETEIAPSDDPYGGVIATNRALGRLLDQVAKFCAETTAER